MEVLRPGSQGKVPCTLAFGEMSSGWWPKQEASPLEDQAQKQGQGALAGAGTAPPPPKLKPDQGWFLPAACTMAPHQLPTFFSQ